MNINTQPSESTLQNDSKETISSAQPVAVPDIAPNISNTNILNTHLNYIKTKTKYMEPCLIIRTTPNCLAKEYLGIRFIPLSSPPQTYSVIYFGGTKFKLYKTVKGKYVTCGISTQTYDNELIEIIEGICDILYSHGMNNMCVPKMCNLCKYKSLYNPTEYSGCCES